MLLICDVIHRCTYQAASAAPMMILVAMIPPKFVQAAAPIVQAPQARMVKGITRAELYFFANRVQGTLKRAYGT